MGSEMCIRDSGMIAASRMNMLPFTSRKNEGIGEFDQIGSMFEPVWPRYLLLFAILLFLIAIAGMLLNALFGLLSKE